MFHKLLTLSLFFLIASSAQAGIDNDIDNPDDQALKNLFEHYWQITLAQNPVRASYLGDKRNAQNWSDLSEAGRTAKQFNNQQALRDLSKIDRETLSEANKVNYDLFSQQYQQKIEAAQYNEELIPIGQRGGIQTLDSIAQRLNFSSAQDYENWLTRIEKLDELMDQTISLMDQGIKLGMMPPKITMQRIPAQIKKQITSDPVNSLFYKPFETLPDFFSQAEKMALQQRAKTTIKDTVIPAYQRLLKYFNEVYLPACPDSIAASDRRNGKAHYEFLVRKFTTTDLSPIQVHELGLKEVKRIRAEMQTIIDDLAFEGDFKAFLTFLRTDPQFYFDTSEELLQAYQATSKRIDPALVKLFGKLPRIPYGVRPIPDAIAPDTTTAYYSRPAADGSTPGWYWVNLYKPETRPKYEIEVLSVHESVPGHHLQLALQQELQHLPDFRRYSATTAYVEGWGLYSERLGYDLGLYKDPYSKFGQLTYDMWRAIRLVVDTGMHYHGWSRDRAIAYFKANAAKTELDIINEIDRYISWPGQALAYKLGQLKILELRAEAETALGDQFDIRAFHDKLLSEGSLPLSILESMMDAWLAEQVKEKLQPTIKPT